VLPTLIRNADTRSVNLGFCFVNKCCILITYSHFTEPMSTSASVAVITVIPSVVSFIIGALVGAVVYYCVQKCYYLTTAHKEQKQVPAPVYEDIIGQTQNIELKQNVAYGPVQQ